MQDKWSIQLEFLRSIIVIYFLIAWLIFISAMDDAYVSFSKLCSVPRTA